MLPRLLGRTTRATRPGVAEAVRQMAGGWSVAGMVGAQRAMRARPDSTETLRGLRLPALVIGGGGDEIAPPPAVRAMGALLLKAPVEIGPGAGHVVAPEGPAGPAPPLAAVPGGAPAGGAPPPPRSP